MAEEHKKGDPMQLLWLVLVGMGVLIFLWFAGGGPKHADLRGLFLMPPAPVGPGGAYGPEIGTPSQYYQQNYGSSAQ